MAETIVYFPNSLNRVKGIGMMTLFSVADSKDILKASQTNSVESDEANKENEVCKI